MPILDHINANLDHINANIETPHKVDDLNVNSYDLPSKETPHKVDDFDINPIDLPFGRSNKTLYGNESFGRVNIETSPVVDDIDMVKSESESGLDPGDNWIAEINEAPCTSESRIGNLEPYKVHHINAKS